jgi:cell division GTPase FtsZ
MMDNDIPSNYLAVIKVVGVGGGGYQCCQPHDRGGHPRR